MWKAIVAGTAALAIAGTSLVYAQQRDRMEGQGWRPSTEDIRAFGEARLAALKAGLMLTTEQEKNWPAFEQAARDLAKVRAEQMSARRNAAQGDDPAERLRQRGTALSETGAALKKLAEATDPLYKSLDENQKRRFQVLGRMAGAGREGSGRHHWEHFGERFGGREGGHGPWFHWGPQHTDDGSGDIEEHSGAERL